MVWCAVSVYGIIGPVFFDGTADAAQYLDVLAELRATLDTDPRFVGRNFMYQQNGAPIHFALAVRAFLDEFFPGWIG